MGIATGKPRGRPPGAKNKRTVELAEAAAAVAAKLAEAIPEAFEGDAHAFMMSVYKNPELENALRLDAAKAAVRFEKPSLAAIEHTGRDGGPIQIILGSSDANL